MSCLRAENSRREINISLQLKMHQKILGITIDNKLTFKSHLKNICKKANQKLNALARISNPVTTGLGLLLLSISATISSKTINTLCFLYGLYSSIFL